MAEGKSGQDLTNMEAIDKVESHIADAVKRGAKDITGGKRHALGGSFFEPTVLSEVGRMHSLCMKRPSARSRR